MSSEGIKNMIQEKLLKTLVLGKFHLLSKFADHIQHIHPNFLNNIDYLLSKTSEKLFAHNPIRVVSKVLYTLL